MSGLLETMMERLIAIETKLDNLGSVASTSPVQTVDEAAAEAVKQEVAATTAAVVEESAANPVESVETGIDLDDAGYPWDERINAKTKTKTAAGVWKLLKGVDKELIPKVREELASLGYGPSGVVGRTVVVTETATPTQPTVSAPSKPTMPDSAPSVPGKPMMPTQLTVQADPKQELLKLVNELQSKHVTPDSIITELLGPFGIDTFDALSADNIVGVTELAKAWLQSIANAHEIIDNLDEIDPNGDNNLVEGANIYIQQHGGTGALGTTPRAQLSALMTTLNQYFEQWDSFLKSQA
ncbi:pyruvate dehydrogenase E1 component [Vibrio phage 103E44.1]|nr:pyruvate dehydrogenase E1 component [Vibrio phage 103E44.1]QZI87886.1 pyruvate dehydrogenase E1 component [Vibrio phage 104E43.1]